MPHLGLVAVVVPDYDEAIAFYVDALGFRLVEDTPLDGGKRWVVVAPRGARETGVLLARADTGEQGARIGDQTGGRVGWFLATEDFDGDHARMLAAGVVFEEPPRHEPYGTVAVFRDPYGNRWDLIQHEAVSAKEARPEGPDAGRDAGRDAGPASGPAERAPERARAGGGPGDAGEGGAAAGAPGPWPAAEPLDTARLRLEPLRVGHAAEAFPLFDDERLHSWIGGSPDSAEELERRYRRQSAGRSPDGTQGWLNWMLRRRSDGHLVGTVQATLLRPAAGRLTAELAWIVGTGHQGNGYAREAAAAMRVWLAERGVDTFLAHVHPDHEASAAVARALGLTPTDTVVDGEVRWRGTER